MKKLKEKIFKKGIEITLKETIWNIFFPYVEKFDELDVWDEGKIEIDNWVILWYYDSKYTFDLKFIKGNTAIKLCEVFRWTDGELGIILQKHFELLEDENLLIELIEILEKNKNKIVKELNKVIEKWNE